MEILHFVATAAAAAAVLCPLRGQGARAVRWSNALMPLAMIGTVVPLMGGLVIWGPVMVVSGPVVALLQRRADCGSITTALAFPIMGALSFSTHEMTHQMGAMEGHSQVLVLAPPVAAALVALAEVDRAVRPRATPATRLSSAFHASSLIAMASMVMV